jgi:uncharacterized glyoxalase superfamily protein PhnB
MEMKRFDVTINTEKFEESKLFYMENLNFQLVYESDWYMELLSRDMAVGVSFTLPQRDEGEFFNGRGIILSMEVDDADGEYQRLLQKGLRIVQDLQNKPWGERSFVIDDPNGVHIYIYKAIPPTEEYKRIYDSFKK